MRNKNIFSILGFGCMFLYSFYLLGYSKSNFFKYLLFVGFVFLTIDLIIYIITIIKSKSKQQ